MVQQEKLVTHQQQKNIPFHLSITPINLFFSDKIGRSTQPRWMRIKTRLRVMNNSISPYWKIGGKIHNWMII